MASADGLPGERGRPTIIIADGPFAPFRVAADLLIAWLAGAIGERGVAHLALTGGSSATGLYQALREPARAGALDWSLVQAWFGDDRFVPLGDPDSNAGLARRELVADWSGPLPASNLHPFPVELALEMRMGPEAAASWYADELLASSTPTDAAGVPAFDVVLLGIGGDGHLLSVFPGSPALAPDAPVVMGIPAPDHITPHVPRMTLSPAILGAAGHLMPIVTGASKAAILGSIFGPFDDPARWPAQLALRASATWILDPASASGLTAR